MADIVSVVDKAVTLTNEEYMREFTPPSTWNTLRLGVLLSTNMSTSLTKRFDIGFCSGTTNGIGHATSVTHFVGAPITESTALRADGNLRFFSSTLIHGYFSGLDIRSGKVVGTTVTTGTSETDTFTNDFQVAHTTNRNLVFIDITKGSPNHTVTVWGNQSNADVTPATMSTRMLEVTPTGMKKNSREVPVDEATDGTLNAVNIFWSPNTARIEIHQIEVARIA